MRPEQTGKGVGSLMLEYLVEEAKKKGRVFDVIWMQKML
jgi:L-amino acid N-acyltransferase YncA